MTVARIAEALAVSWDTANDAVLAEGRRVCSSTTPTRIDGVQAIRVDDHCWRYTRRGDKFVKVIIDLTPIRDVLAYFDRPGTSNGPTEAINGRLEHLRG